MATRTTDRRPAKTLRTRVDAARLRWEGSWAGHIAQQLKALDFGMWITMFGASLLWSAVPLLILLSSFANETIDDDLSHHIGLNNEGANIVHTLFRGTPAHGLEPILTGFIFSFAGVVAVVSSLQLMYERIFGLEQRGWSNWWRWVAWIAALIALLFFEGEIRDPVMHATGVVVNDAIGVVASGLFFWWTMHFLLAGRVPWRSLARPAASSCALWFGFALFSTVYFSPLLISDSHTYGSIGVVFTLLTWFFLIGAVIVIGAVLGVAWQARAEHVDEAG